VPVYVMLQMKESAQTRALPTSSLLLGIAVFLLATPLGAQESEAASGGNTRTEYYTPSLTPAIYLINFLFLYIANPDIAAYLPAYKAPVPQPVIDCLKQHPEGCPYAAFRNLFDEQTVLRGGSGVCFWPDACREEAKWERLAPREFRLPEEINEPLGKD